MMSYMLFFRILAENDKEYSLEQAISNTNNGHILDSTTYVADPSSFSQTPGSTFAYWINEYLRNIFIKFPSMEGNGRTIKQGLATADDFRFLRLYWEISPDKAISAKSSMEPKEFLQQTFQGKRWVPFAKGGAYSPYYSDLHLVVNWERDAEDLKNFRDPDTGKQLSYIRNAGFYFRPGLTWSIKNRYTFKPRPLNAGCIFAHVGAAAFINNETELLSYQGLMSSAIFTILLRVTAGWNFEVGVIQRTPIPTLLNSEDADSNLKKAVLSCVNIKRSIKKNEEINHNFHLPKILQKPSKNLTEIILEWKKTLLINQEMLNVYQDKIDTISFQMYGIQQSDRNSLEKIFFLDKVDKATKNTKDEIDDEEDETEILNITSDLLSYTFGCPFGRWDIRCATGEHPEPELPDPFAPLPVCSPGMLTGENGLPLRTTPAGYPLDIKWDGIMVDDPDHPDDIIRRVREVLAVIWQDRAEAIEQEICQILEISDLRDYFRRPGKGGFWDDHIQRYSKSRRKAPIYWLLQSEKRNYGIWVYYHRLDKDLLFKALVNYVEPKLRMEEDTLAQLKAAQNPALVGREAKQVEQKIERQERLLTELSDFRDKLSRAAHLGLKPDLNDGVVLNIAPLRELVPWKEAKKYWDELEKGKYEWSSISQQLHAKGKV